MLFQEPLSDGPVRERRIVHRTPGRTHGPITRLMSPGDLGELVKPFVFLDHFAFDGGSDGGVVHPHSGIATHTTLLEGSLVYGDSTGKSGTLRPGSLEWMQAGGGVWHGGTVPAGQRLRGFQLWVALAPPFELAPAESHYVDAASVPVDGRVRVLLGSYGALKSPIPYSADVSYLHVHLNDGERWTFRPHAHHDVAWLAVSQGTLLAGTTPLAREMAVFEPGNAPVALSAPGGADFVIASGIRHDHRLVLGQYSVHTTRENLERGEAGIGDVAAGMSLVPWRPLSASPR